MNTVSSSKQRPFLKKASDQGKAKIDFATYAQMVEKKAYELYEKRGCINGYDREDWFEAEKCVEEELCQNK